MTFPTGADPYSSGNVVWKSGHALAYASLNRLCIPALRASHPGTPSPPTMKQYGSASSPCASSIRSTPVSSIARLT